MTRQQAEDCLELLSGVHWMLYRIHMKLERGTHRHCIAQADGFVCDVLNELKDQAHPLRAIGEEK